MSQRASLYLVVSLLGGCGDLLDDVGPAPSLDGGVDDSTTGVIAPPDIPWLAEGTPPITLGPCPSGWREVHGGLVTECDPYPEGGEEACDLGEAHFPGERGCRPIGDSCPLGDYAASLPSSGVLYVKAGAPSGGDGALETPFAMISEVPWVSLTAPTTVALGKGTYPGILALKAGVTIIGACVRETIVTGISAPVRSVIQVTQRGEPASVNNLTIRGAPQSGAIVSDGRHLFLRGVLFENVTGFGLLGDGAGTEINLTDVVIRGTETAPSGGSALGVSTLGSVVTLRDTLIRDTLPAVATGLRGRGLEVGEGAEISATRLVVAGNHDVGVLATHSGARLTLTDVVIRDTLPETSGESQGRGLGVQGGAQCDAVRLLVAGNGGLGAYVSGDGSALSFTDVAIRRSSSTGAPTVAGAGRGVTLQEGASFEASRLLVANAAEFGIFVVEEGTRASLSDVVIQDVQPRADDRFGRGLHGQAGAQIDGARMAIERTLEIGVLALAEARVRLTDTTIRSVHRAECASGGCPDAPFGYGAAAIDGLLSLKHFLVTDAALCGVLLAAPNGRVELDLEDGTISRTMVGACVQVDGYDLGRLTADVRYTDNTRNLDTTMLALPSPVDGINV